MKELPNPSPAVPSRDEPSASSSRPVADHLVVVRHQVTSPERAARAGHTGAVVWLTGLPGSGKSTLAMALERRLFDRGWQAYTLDGDNMRHGLNADLGFSPADRQENIRRVGEVAALFADAGAICITAFISPYREDRARARAAAGARRFFEVHVNTPLATCERRDPKGHYRKARAGLIKDFTGVDAPYEAPDRSDLEIDTEGRDVDASVGQLLTFVVARCAVDGPALTRRLKRARRSARTEDAQGRDRPGFSGPRCRRSPAGAALRRGSDSCPRSPSRYWRWIVAAGCR